MRSVPPRGSGWVSIAVIQVAACVVDAATHPLPRGGTDLMGPWLEWGVETYPHRFTALALFGFS